MELPYHAYWTHAISMCIVSSIEDTALQGLGLCLGKRLRYPDQSALEVAEGIYVMTLRLPGQTAHECKVQHMRDRRQVGSQTEDREVNSSSGACCWLSIKMSAEDPDFALALSGYAICNTCIDPFVKEGPDDAAQHCCATLNCCPCGMHHCTADPDALEWVREQLLPHQGRTALPVEAVHQAKGALWSWAPHGEG